jgi:hypothetical protein
MALKPLVVAVTLVAVTSPLVSQDGSWDFSVAVRGALTTSAKLFYLPDDSSEIVRSRYEVLENIFGAALEARARPPGSSFFFSLSAEYQRTTREKDQLLAFTAPPSVLPTEDGYWMIPLEATVSVDVPLGSEQFGLTMGAGIGAYLAERLLSVAGVRAVPLDAPLAFGLHVRTSADYRITSWLTVMAELRFRNPHISTRNQFQQETATIDGLEVVFPQDIITGRLEVGGMVVGLGVVLALR